MENQAAIEENQIIEKPVKLFLFQSIEFWIGIALLITNIGIFLKAINNDTNRDMFGFAMMTFCISALYGFILLISGKMKVFWKSQPFDAIHFRILHWLIWIVSCFTLNREIVIFQESVDWLCGAIILSFLTGIMYAWEKQFSLFFRQIFYILLGFSTILWVYFMIYLLWVYPIAFIGILFMGLGFHAFIPILLLITHIKILVNANKTHLRNGFIGIGLPVVFAIVFVIKWAFQVKQINLLQQKSLTANTDELPNWVLIAQKIKNDFISERILKSDLVYQLFKGDFDFSMNRMNWAEVRRHDPFVMIASAFSDKINLAESDQIKLLETRYDARHETEERLWSGRSLSTKAVTTHVKIYPDFRLAYTEKTLSIHNSEKWGSGEAIYTFYVPEGTVVTSLSLWINGKEEKGYLTTQSKADSAYKTIVGVEARDPSVVHWQEGNTLRVRVFPCTANENRQFKVGFTSPLRFDNVRLVYDNIYFKGPESSSAEEFVKIDFSGKVEDLETPWGSKFSTQIEKEQHYKPDWNLSFKYSQLSKETFEFQGKSYSVEPFQPTFSTTKPQNCYLDINAAWNKSDYDFVCKTLKFNNLWIFDEKLIEITSENKDEIFEKLSANKFSLFPIYRIKDFNNSLLITSGNPTAPNLKNLAGSVFGNNFKSIASQKGKLRTISFNKELSPYLKTLKELQVLQQIEEEDGRLTLLKLHSQASQSQTLNTDNQAIAVIPLANMLISEKPQPQSTSPVAKNNIAPDHLLRLYAYNHILQQIGNQYFQKEYLTDSLIAEASRANIVTPISSLIVLETQKDYDRFDIKKSNDSLGNATMKNSGSVPEPHEWILIALLVLVISYFTFKNYVKI